MPVEFAIQIAIVVYLSSEWFQHVEMKSSSSGVTIIVFQTCLIQFIAPEFRDQGAKGMLEARPMLWIIGSFDSLSGLCGCEL